jgi:hypothetical protein
LARPLGRQHLEPVVRQVLLEERPRVRLSFDDQDGLACHDAEASNGPARRTDVLSAKSVTTARQRSLQASEAD